MNLWSRIRKTTMVFLMCFCLCAGLVPAIEAQAAEVQVKTQTQNVEAEEDDGFTMIILGGGLLIIIFAVVVSVSSASSAMFIVGSMDGDEE